VRVIYRELMALVEPTRMGKLRRPKKKGQSGVEAAEAAATSAARANTPPSSPKDNGAPTQAVKGTGMEADARAHGRSRPKESTAETKCLT